MITNFKLFESMNEGEPEIGDWVICEEEDGGIDDVSLFTSTNIGKYVKLESELTYNYLIHYENVPKNLEQFFSFNGRNMNLSEIKYCSKK